jgi:hypothetical protein
MAKKPIKKPVKPSKAAKRNAQKAKKMSRYGEGAC